MKLLLIILGVMIFWPAHAQRIDLGDGVFVARGYNIAETIVVSRAFDEIEIEVPEGDPIVLRDVSLIVGTITKVTQVKRKRDRRIWPLKGDRPQAEINFILNCDFDFTLGNAQSKHCDGFVVKNRRGTFDRTIINSPGPDVAKQYNDVAAEPIQLIGFLDGVEQLDVQLDISTGQRPDNLAFIRGWYDIDGDGGLFDNDALPGPNGIFRTDIFWAFNGNVIGNEGVVGGMGETIFFARSH